LLLWQLKRFSRREALIFILILIALAQQLPVIKDFAYSELRILIYLLMLILLLKIPFSTIVYMRIPRILQVFLFAIFLIVAQSLIFRIIGGSVRLDFLIEPFVSFAILYVSCTYSHDDTKVELIVSAYIILSTILSVSTALYYGPGLFIIPDRYTVAFKSGPTYAAMYASILSFGRLLRMIKDNTINWRTRLYKESYYTMIIIFNYTAIIAIKSRSALIGTSLGIALLLLFSLKYNVKLYVILIISLIMVIISTLFGFTPIRDAFEGTLFLGYDRQSADSILSGRLSLSQNAILFSKNNLLFGEIFGETWYFDTRPHNYFLNKIVSFGLVGSIPFVFLYLVLAAYCFFNLTRARRKRILISRDIGIVLLTVSFAISIVEYSLPFGPGATQFIVWFLVGQYEIRRRRKHIVVVGVEST
jgi:hypothetical protein